MSNQGEEADHWSQFIFLNSLPGNLSLSLSLSSHFGVSLGEIESNASSKLSKYPTTSNPSICAGDVGTGLGISVATYMMWFNVWSLNNKWCKAEVTEYPQCFQSRFLSPVLPLPYRVGNAALTLVFSRESVREPSSVLLHYIYKAQGSLIPTHPQ